MPKVSICLPVFNGKKYLTAAIDSVLAQTHDDFELLISDDGSTDGSFELCTEYANKDKRIVLWRNPSRLGLFPNYNACIERASGEYIKLFAQDDLLFPKNLEANLDYFSEYENLAMVASARTIINEGGDVIETYREFDEDRVFSGEEVVESNIFSYFNWVGEPTCVFYPAKFKGTGFDTVLFHYGDIEYWFQIAMNGKMVYASEPLCSFRWHEGSATKRNMRSLNFIADLAYIGEKYKDFLAERNCSQEKYWQKMVTTISPWVYSMADDEGLAEPDSSDIDQFDEATRKRLLKVMRKIAFHSLVKLTSERERSESLRYDLERELFDREEQISALVSDRAFKAASSVKKVLKRFGNI